jgi:hypothetical protein
MADCMRPVVFTATVLLAALVAAGAPTQAQTLKAVKERGTLNCGVGQGLLGFSSQVTRAIGAASTSISAARSPLPCSAIP